ncbi:MAG: hypothetical protein WB626_01410 [Bacteroidota bacterium]
MRIHLVGLLSLMLCSCASREAVKAPDTTPPPPAPSPATPPPPTTVKQNVSLIGSVILGMELVDDMNYRVQVTLHTVIPDRGSESIAEIGQVVTLVPAYENDESGEISLTSERNTRLFAVRSLEKGRFVLGRITLAPDGTWYLLDTELN